jgi:hypothetical protein
LQAIFEGLDDELQWPNKNHRRELANTYSGIFQGCIGIEVVKEFEIEKPIDRVKEKQSWSGKKKVNSYKMLSVMDCSGRYIFVRVVLGKNDREVLTSSSDGEFVAADGTFDGDGQFRCSYKNPGYDEIKKLFNLACREV